MLERYEPDIVLLDIDDVKVVGIVLVGELDGISEKSIVVIGVSPESFLVGTRPM
jgi:hypothetical protein